MSKRTLPIGMEHELLQKLEFAGLTEEDATRIINARGNKVAISVIELLRNGNSTVVARPQGEGVFHSISTTGLSLRELKTRNPKSVYITPYLGSNSAIDRKGEEGRQIEVRMSPLPRTFNKTIKRQLAMISDGLFVPEACDLVHAILAYIDATGNWPFTNERVRTATVVDDGSRLIVACIIGRVIVQKNRDVNQVDLGLAVARNSS